MKKISFLLPLLFALSAYSQTTVDHTTTIELPEQLKKHVYTLAADSMAGRETGEPGQKMAADYISSHFRNYKLDSLDFNNYYQSYNLFTYNRGRAYISYKATGRWAKKRNFMSFFGHAFFTHPISYNDTLTFSYLGYGKQVPKQKLKNMVVVLLLDRDFGTTYGNIKDIAKDTEARFFVVLFPKIGFRNFNPQKHSIGETNKVDRLNGLFDRFSTCSLEKNVAKYQQSVDSYKEFVAHDDTLLIALARPERAQSLFNVSYKELVKLEKKITKGKASRDIPFRNDTAIVFADTKMLIKDTVQTENVVAFIEGTAKKDEVIVVSAHYDHLGKHGERVMSGADDNASGTAAVMEMANALEQLTAEKGNPLRSILFVAFSGEEIGLRGSDYFVSNCPIPIESVVLNMNLDMVGRNRAGKEKYNETVFFLANGKRKRMYKRMAKRNGKLTENLDVSFHPGLDKRLIWTFSSDHFRFKRRNIPFVTLFTGLHPDYHTSRDTPDKINYPKLTEITRVGSGTLWQIANSDKNIQSRLKTPTSKNLIERLMD